MACAYCGAPSGSLAVTHDPLVPLTTAPAHQITTPYQIARVAASHKSLANWRPTDFAAAVDGDVLVQGSVPEGQTAKGLLEADKKLLHSSGPVKTYYKFARTDRVPEFGKEGGSQ